MKIKNYSLQKNKGFTLLELLLVIAIIAVLAGIVLAALNPSLRLQQTNQTKTISHVNELEKAINAYVIDHKGQYPTELQTYFNQGAKTVSICKQGQNCVGTKLNELLSEGYISNIPINDGYDTSDKSGFDINISNSGISVIDTNYTPGYIIKDEFIVDDNAPLTSPRTAEPGPGILNIVQTGTASLNIVNGKITFATNGDNLWGRTGIYGQGLPRRPGRTLITSMDPTTYGDWAGPVWSRVGSTDFNGYGNMANGIYNGLYVVEAQTIRGDVGLVNNQAYKIALILKQTGAYYLAKGSNLTNWTLLWPGSLDSTSIVYPAIGLRSATFTSDGFRVLDLPAPWNDDYGISTNYLVGTRSAGDTFLHEANAIIEWTQITIPTVNTTDIWVRQQDINNGWVVSVNTTGNLTLFEVVNGTYTQRANSSSAVVASGNRIMVILEANTIKGYSNNSLRWTYSGASNFSTKTDGRIHVLGIGGSVSNIICYPRYLTGSAAAVLDKAIE